MRKFKFVFILVFVVGIFNFLTINVKAACEPPECGGIYGNCSGWGPEYQCIAKCCVIPAGGGGGNPTPTPGRS